MHRRPPPPDPHPDQASPSEGAAEAGEAEADTADQEDAANLKEENESSPHEAPSADAEAATELDFRDPLGVVPPKGFPVVPSSCSPVTQGTPQIQLMEAMASRDFVSMKTALVSADARAVHAAMLNACAKGNQGAVTVLLPKASASP